MILQAGGGSEGLELAGSYASGVYANPYDITSAREHRQAIRQSAIGSQLPHNAWTIWMLS